MTSFKTKPKIGLVKIPTNLPMSSFVNAGCELSSPPDVFLAVYVLSKGRPCVGCGYDMEGTCKARIKLTTSYSSHIPKSAHTTETVRQQAARMKISISEVRRRRREGQ